MPKKKFSPEQAIALAGKEATDPEQNSGTSF